jgi:hypothetical protein
LGRTRREKKRKRKKKKCMKSTTLFLYFELLGRTRRGEKRKRKKKKRCMKTTTTLFLFLTLNFFIFRNVENFPLKIYKGFFFFLKENKEWSWNILRIYCKDVSKWKIITLYVYNIYIYIYI